MLKIIISMLIWGSIGLFIKYIPVPSMEVAFLRAVIATFFLSIAGFWLKKEDTVKNIRRNFPLLLLSGAALGLNWILLFQAYKYTTLSNATLSYYLAPVFIVLLSPIILKEKLSKKKILSVLLALGGLYLIVSHQSNTVNGTFQHEKGILFGICAATLYASVVLLNKYLKNISGYEMTLVQMAVSSLVLLPFVLYRNQIHMEKGTVVFLILVIGILHTGIAYLLYFTGIKEVKAQSAAILSYIDPVFAILLGILFLKEPMNTWQILGGVFILGSTFIGNQNEA